MAPPAGQQPAAAAAAKVSAQRGDSQSVEVWLRCEGSLRWVNGLAFPAPEWWPAGVPWPDRAADPTPMSSTLWTVLVRRAIIPAWELAQPPVPTGPDERRLLFEPRVSAFAGSAPDRRLLVQLAATAL